MYADRYQRQASRPGSLAAAATVTGALVLGLMSAAPDTFMPERFKDLIVTAIPLDPPPPPQPEKRVEHRVDKPIAQPRSQPEDVKVVDLPPLPTDNSLTGKVDVLPPLPPFHPPAGGTTTEPAVKPAPVLTEAAPDPRYARDFQPPYPPAKERAGESGRVTVRVLIGADGRVRAVEPVGEVDDAFFATTRRQALAHWRFKPATRDGIAYETWHRISVRFVLND